MPSSIPSNWPFIMVTGVFSSCETAEKKFVRACSSSFSCSISASSFLFAFCKSDRAVERLRDSLFRLFFKKDCLDCVQIIKSYLSETEDLIVGKDLQIDLKAPPSALIAGNR